MRIGWISAAPYATTGYGIITKHIVSRLIDVHEVYCIGGIGGQTVWGGKMDIEIDSGKLIHVLPTIGDYAGSGVAQTHIQKYNLDLVISFWDCFAVEYTGNLSVPAINYIPIDAPFTSKMANYVRNATRIVAYSKYGYKELLRFFPPSKIAYIDHGIDTSVYKPYPEVRKDVREQMHPKPVPENAYLMIDVGANIGERKQIPLLMLVFKEFLKKYKNSYLYLYTNMSAPFPRGYSLEEFARELGIIENLRYPKYDTILEPLEDQQMAYIYSSADAFVTPTIGEGRGMPILEALSCGIPVIGTNCSAVTELIYGHGWLVDTIPEKDYKFVPVWVPTLQIYPVPSMSSLLEKMEEAYNSPSKLAEYGKKSREFALKYDWKEIMPKWFKLLDEVEGEIELFKSFRV